MAGKRPDLPPPGTKRGRQGLISRKPERGLGVEADETHELASEVSHRGEDIARDDFRLDLRKPDLDLVKPAGIGRGVVDSDGGVLRKKCKDFLGLVRTEVIGNDVDLRLGGLTVEDLGQTVETVLMQVRNSGFGVAGLRLWL